MKARLIIADAAYGPEKLKQIFKAFDDAWDVIAPSVGSSPAAIEAARVRLANIILGLASNGSLDPEQMTSAAIKMMADKSP